jgi:site-specific DNA-cytosine methylase
VNDFMRYHTRSGSVYEVDEDKHVLRRLGEINPGRSGKRLDDGEWHPYQSILTTARSELRIQFDPDYVIFTTKIIKVEGIN